jgi:GNAT superfamily N-acetyltransferase/uncharacterized damage-inducible protein DinB
MEQTKWFDRKFDFHFGMEAFPNLLERLEKSAGKFREIIIEASEQELNFKSDREWSVKEHIGHLSILEPLWQKRFSEIKTNLTEMSPADLTNKGTDEALFNQYAIEKIINDFEQERKNTVQLLKCFSGKDFELSVYHPRLKQPMRIIDLMYFVAEHDIHHMKRIIHILNTFPRVITAITQKDIQLCEAVILELRPHLKDSNLWEQYRKQLDENYQILYVCKDEKAMAFIGYRTLNMFYSGKTLYIDDLCTLPESRGKGYARLLLDKVFAIAKAANCNTISLDSGHHRYIAHRLYLNIGFDIVDHHFEKKI